ncbi:MAG: hypothetical protein LC117_04085 [Bacteroidia bacterium]|nr:hypothetical protein [Bacteroidia bacterium]MCZ2277088.1 hypothetical protein [Bacteroidia bacterium]
MAKQQPDSYHLLLIAIGCIAWLLAGSCKKSFFKKDSETKVVALAKAYDKIFTLDDLRKLIPEKTHYEDSVLMAKSFIDNWIRKEVILYQAKKNLPDKMMQVEAQLEEYRTSLISYIYESEWINQRLDTNVTEKEISDYYNANSQNFELKNNILKVVYVKVPREAPKLDKLRNWFRSSSEKDKRLLADYCYQFATDFRFDEENWIIFDELIKSVPIRTYDKEHFLRNNRELEVTDSSSVYLIRIIDFKIKESLSPLAFEKENIKALILNKRKLELIRDMEKKSIEKAILNKDVEIYENIPN